MELDRYQHSQLVKSVNKQNAEERKINYEVNDGTTKKQLFLFNDKSASMWKKPFEALKQAQRELAEILYSDELSSQKFDKVELMFYNDSITHTYISSKSHMLKVIDQERPDRGTDFIICFDWLLTSLTESNTDNCIVFFTDGCDTINKRQVVVDKMLSLKKTLKELDVKKNISTKIYCIGLSEDHDAQLLNSLAQLGSNQGNFIYVDTTQSDYEWMIKEALNSSICMAINHIGMPKILVTNTQSGKRGTLEAETSYGFAPVQAVMDPQQLAGAQLPQ